MSKNLKRASKKPSQRPVPPVEYAGQWIVWDQARTKIIAHAPSLDEADQLARATGHEQFIVQKLPRIDAVFIGAL